MVKMFFCFIGLGVIFILVFYLFGSSTEDLLSQDKCIEWFTRIKPVAWLIGILLLVSDIVTPVPATGIMAALGAVYGVVPGAFFSVIGSTGAGLVGYGAARTLGLRGSRWIADEKEIERFKDFFDRWGGYAVILSRATPILPEVISILAGISRMKFSRFFAALLAGTIPTSFLFSWMGSYPGLPYGTGIVLALLVPALLWPVFIRMVKI
ncbi:MAG: VTT domain-containing protein [Desulfobacula sp.]|jgi:uncharacterized membrane protein YdjX (TVP38/TMEM64 family)